MNRRLFVTLVLIIAISAAALAQSEQQSQPLSSAQVVYQNRYFTGEVFTGYFAGVGLHVAATVNHFADGFPFQLRLGLGYAWVPTGDAMRARRVFIDQATNGSPRGHGKMWDARVDILMPIKLFSLKRSRFFVGARKASYNAYFEYIGGNETFDVISKPWGVGGGLETSFALSPRVDMIVTAGADYYFRSLLTGHDTYYRPNGDDLNAKEDFTYKDADEAIAQPNLNTRIMFGVAYHF